MTSAPVPRGLTAVDLFAGAGGLSLGLQQAGFEPSFALELDPLACGTYRKNLKSHVLEADIRDYSPSSLVTISGLQRYEVDLVAGGPPCQGFSTQRRGPRADLRNDLVVEFAKAAVAFSPRVILVENVPGLLGERGATVRDQMFEVLDKSKYEFQTAVLNAANYGVPQSRRRALVVAWDPARAKPVSLPMPHGTERTVRSAIAELPEPLVDFSPHPDYANHIRVKMSALNLLRISHVPPGGGRLDIPEDLQLDCHRGSGHRHLDVYGRMDWDAPAPTITAMFDNFTRGRFAHPSSDRSITGREGARLQSYPDDFLFLGPKKDVARQIGNSVPPLLARAVGLQLAQACAD